jgi:hypothetical protein
MGETAATRCPFPLALTLFALVSVGGSAALFVTERCPPVALLALQLVCIAAFAVCLESQRAKGSGCPWLDVSASRRLILYGTLWFVGLLMLLPVGMMGLAPLPVLGAVGVLVVVPAVALVRQHVIVDHGEFEEAGVPWWLFASARLPVYFLLLVGILVAILMVLTFLPWTRPS